MRPFSLADRSAGVLLHITSLPNGPFTGDLGRGAHAFADWLAGAGQRWWQMLPVNPIGDGDSPYSTVSSFAGEPLLIGLEPLVAAGWLAASELPKATERTGGKADYRRSRRLREPLLRRAFARAAPRLARDKELAAFRRREAFWLRDYALFTAIGDERGTRDWSCWPDPLKWREPEALRDAERRLGDEIAYLEFVQYAFHRQWSALKSRAAKRGVGLIGDLPIFVSHRSADVWAHPELFLLDRAGRPKVVAGCPPDAFNADGQLWGNALYDWAALERQRFAWWLARLGRMLDLFDAIRLDHFIGFYRYWEIAAQAKNARGGTWRKARGDAFFKAVFAQLGRAELIAEDLGAVIPPVRALRDKFGLPGMKVLQFAFDGSAEAEHHKPHLLPAKPVVYTGTHDNATTRGWIEDLGRRGRRDAAARREHDDVLTYLGGKEADAAARLTRAALASPANVAVLPLQDYLGQGRASRMNVPGVAKGNWRYRAPAAALTPALQAELAALARLNGRDLAAR